MSILNLKNQIVEIINQCKDTPVEAPYQRSCKLVYTLSFKVLKICGEPLEGANVTINPFAIKNEEEKEVTKEDGSVSFKELKRKHYVIEVEYDGFHKKVETVMLPQNKTFFIQFELDDIKDDEFKITLIPRIMRKNGWIKGAELMEHWFKQKAYTYPDPENVDTGKEPYNKDIITLAWVKRFEEVKEAYDEIWDDKIYASDAVKDNIKKECISLNIFNKLTKIGDEFTSEELSNDPNKLIVNSDQYKKVLSTLDKGEYLLWKSHDDLMAALANFTFKLNIEYKVKYKGIEKNYFTKNKKVYLIKITKVAVFVRDSYSFEGVNELGLGHWDYEENDMDALNFFSKFDNYTKVTNKMYRDWRDKNKCGGDFLVFSDVEMRDVEEEWEVELDI